VDGAGSSRGNKKGAGEKQVVAGDVGNSEPTTSLEVMVPMMMSTYVHIDD
jgi:hypothetical protein